MHQRHGAVSVFSVAVFREKLVELGEERVVDGKPMFGVASGGEFFAMAEARALREFA